MQELFGSHAISAYAGLTANLSWQAGTGPVLIKQIQKQEKKPLPAGLT
jgi:hypothetical protein